MSPTLLQSRIEVSKIWSTKKGDVGQKANLGRFSKILKFHPIDLKFEQDLQIRSMNSTTYYVCGYHRQKVNIDRISKILNLNPINLKFEEHLHIRSLNSTTY